MNHEGVLARETQLLFEISFWKQTNDEDEERKPDTEVSRQIFEDMQSNKEV